MTRRESVTIYVSKEEKKNIKQEADRMGKSISTYCYDLVQEQRRENAHEDIADRLDAEERLERLLTEGLKDFDKMADDLREQHGQHGQISHNFQEIEDELNAGESESNAGNTSDDNCRPGGTADQARSDDTNGQPWF